MLPHEGLSTAIANMININISTIAGVSTFQGISTVNVCILSNNLSTLIGIGYEKNFSTMESVAQRQR
jgi:hypothetical protein